MATYTVDDAVLNSAAAQDYFTRKDRRYVIGLRAALEMLSIPLPRYAVRNNPGVTPAKSVAAAFRADNPERSTLTLAPRKPNASPDAVAAARLRHL